MKITFNTNINRISAVQNPLIKSNKLYSFNSATDVVTFGRNPKILGEKESVAYIDKYKTSTSGYRGVLGEDFNDKFVYTMSQAAGKYMVDHKNSFSPKTIIGGDTREATKIYAPQIASIFQKNGIDVFYPQLPEAKGDEISPVASPVLALATKMHKVPLGVLLTASHNPWSDGGYNFLIEDGMVAESRQSDEIAKNISDIVKAGKNPIRAKKQGRRIIFDPYKMYKKYLDKKGLVDFENIKNANIDIFYEDLCGTGKYYFPHLLKDHGIELKGLLSTKTLGPNPTEENLSELSKVVRTSDNPLRIGLATDGDSDRFGAVDENGNFIDANDFLMLCAYHLIKNKGMNQGTIVKNHSTSDRIELLADYFNKRGCDIDVKYTPVGFKYLGSEMMKLKGTPKEIILAGESSGGLTIRGHLPEKDGFVAILTLADLVATEKKPLSEILKEVKSITGSDYKSENVNIRFPSEKEKTDTVDSFAPYSNGEKKNLLGYKIDEQKTIEHNNVIKGYKSDGDGYKIYLDNNSSVLVRKSGTEPIMRYFIDSSDKKVLSNLKENLINYALGSNGEIIP